MPQTTPTARRMVAVMVLVPVLVGLALWAFTWPASRTAPRDLPLGVAGPAQATAPLQKQLERRPDAFEIHRYADERAAREAVEHREVYGAVVASPQGVRVLTASAASPVVAQLLQDAVRGQAPEHLRVTTEDVVPTPDSDPRGAVLSSSALPLALAGMALGAMVTVLGFRGARALVVLVGAACLTGLVGVLLAHNWLGALSGAWWAELGVLALAALASGSVVAGLGALLGQPGLGVGALLVVLLGNPFSGLTSAPELLPQPAGFLGQLLPPGAAGSALRSVAYFDGHGAGVPLLTLAVWVILGTVAVMLGARRGTASRQPEGDPAPA
ncbi:ABC transporter permease [Streptomyces sp. NPDC005438]|uniref:ABC transporter permease n=1 Tax=Streptomyces sp. NPDC005438 TaxID=3156880 RepID=UPI0033BEEF37